MWWLFAYVGLSTAGLLVLGVLAVRVHTAVRDLARQVAVSSHDLAVAGERLRRAAQPLAERGGEITRH